MKTRIYFLDNLRTFLIFLVVLLHAGLVYESVLEQSWIVVDPDKNNSIGLIRMYLDIFVMFVMFFISGYFIRQSVLKNSTTDFIKSKFRRIMIPWAVAVLTLIPAYKAIFLYSRGLPQQEWYSYFHFFHREGGNMFFFADNPIQNWLWFLPVLFMFQVIYMALSRSGLFSKRVSLKTGVILTFVIGVIYSFGISYFELTGWYNSPILHFQRERLLIYFMAFLLGALCNKLNVFDSDVKKWKYYIISNIVLTISLGIFTAVALNLFFNMIDPSRNYYFISPFVDKLAYYTTMLSSMLSFLQILIHVFRYNLNRTGKVLRELSKNSYYVYIIHMIVIGMIAIALAEISMPTMLKYLLLTILTFFASNILVSGYRDIFRNLITKKSVYASILVIVLFTLAFCDNHKPVVIQNTGDQTIEVQEDVPVIDLHKAVLTGNIEAVVKHIKSDSDLNVKDASGGSSPLITAIVFGNTEIALILIEAGADVNFKNNEGSTPLHTASFFCRLEIVDALLAAGADKTIKNNAGSTALDSVLAPFEAVKGIYDYFGKTLGPLGLILDYDHIINTRPLITDKLMNHQK